jgi:ketosteroid isomerase-like protein
MKLLTGVCLIAMIACCAAAHGQEAGAQAGRAAVDALLNELLEATKKCDAGAFAATFADQAFVAVLEFEGQTYMFGRDEFVDTLAGYWMGATTTAAALDDPKVKISGNVALVSGRFRHDANAYPMPIEAEARLLLAREGEGWRILCAALVVEGMPVTEEDNAQVQGVAEAVRTWSAAFRGAGGAELEGSLSSEAFAARIDLGMEQFSFANRGEFLALVQQALAAGEVTASEMQDLEIVVVGGVAVATAHWPMEIAGMGQIDLQASLLLARPLMNWEIVALVAGPRAAEEPE